ncbi:hypothetical protein CLV49_2509 [Labedella gwakjiensis]|nr:hypothetical protein CLV49_2509 [Labedella gwakjiensis]
MDDYPSLVVKIDLATLREHAPRAVGYPDVLRAGFERGLITAEDLVANFLARYDSGCLSKPEETIALLLSDEFDRIGPLLAESAPGDVPSPRAREVWMFATAAALRSIWPRLSDPWGELDLIAFAWGDLPEYVALRAWEPARTESDGRTLGRLDRLDALLAEKRETL